LAVANYLQPELSENLSGPTNSPLDMHWPGKTRRPRRHRKSVPAPPQRAADHAITLLR
jgi:hypothetical protein